MSTTSKAIVVISVIVIAFAVGVFVGYAAAGGNPRGALPVLGSLL